MEGVETPEGRSQGDRPYAKSSGGFASGGDGLFVKVSIR